MEARCCRSRLKDATKENSISRTCRWCVDQSVYMRTSNALLTISLSTDILSLSLVGGVYRIRYHSTTLKLHRHKAGPSKMMAINYVEGGFHSEKRQRMAATMLQYTFLSPKVEEGPSYTALFAYSFSKGKNNVENPG